MASVLPEMATFSRINSRVPAVKVLALLSSVSKNEAYNPPIRVIIRPNPIQLNRFFFTALPPCFRDRSSPALWKRGLCQDRHRPLYTQDGAKVFQAYLVGRT